MGDLSVVKASPVKHHFMVIHWIFVSYRDKDNVSTVSDSDERSSTLIMMIICKCFSKKRATEPCHGLHRWLAYLWQRYRHSETDSGSTNG